MLNKHKEKQKETYDRNSIEYNFTIGDLVLLKNETGHKLDKQYLGPFRIKEILLKENVNIIDIKTNKEQVVHKNRLKIYKQ